MTAGNVTGNDLVTAAFACPTIGNASNASKDRGSYIRESFRHSTGPIITATPITLIGTLAAGNGVTALPTVHHAKTGVTEACLVTLRKRYHPWRPS